MKTAFLIVNYNDASTTMKLIHSIQAYQCLDLIVVVDNQSTDDSLTALSRHQSKHIHVIQSQENKGYGTAINFGSEYIVSVIGDCHIIVSNSDIEIEDEQVIAKLITNIPDDAGIVAPIVKEHRGENKGWKIPSPFQDGLLNILGLHRILRKYVIFYPTSYYQNTLQQVEVVSGSFFLIDSVCLREAGYFDEEVFLYYEENVIAKKMQNIHKKTYVNMSVSVFHNHSVTIDKSVSRGKKYRLLKKSQLYFHQKYSDAGLFSQLFLRGTEQFSYFFLKFWYLF